MVVQHLNSKRFDNSGWITDVESEHIHYFPHDRCLIFALSLDSEWERGFDLSACIDGASFDFDIIFSAIMQVLCFDIDTRLTL